MALSQSNKDSTRTIIRSAASFFSGTMLSRLSGMVRDMAMAWAFGIGADVAALLVAFRLSHLLRRVLGEGAMQTALVPHFEQLRHEDSKRKDNKRASQFFIDLIASLSLLTFVIILAIMGLLYPLYSFEILSAGNKEIAYLAFLMMPSLLFICLFGLNASLLQCEKKFFIPSMAPVVFNCIWIIGVMYAYSNQNNTPMTTLALFITLACFSQWAFTLPVVYKTLKSLNGNVIPKKFTLFSCDVLRLKTPLALGIVGVAASQVNNALDALFARWASDEGPAILWYAIRLQQLPLALFGIALAGALLPPLSRAAKAKDIPLFSQFLSFAITKTFALMLPITALLFLLGDKAVALIYGHGTFSDFSIATTTQALWGYSLGLTPMAMVLILAPACYAQGNYKTPSLAATCSVAINIGLNFVMVQGLHLGGASIAVATSVCALVNCVWLLSYVSKNSSAMPAVMPFAIPPVIQWKRVQRISLVTGLAGLSIILYDLLILKEVSAWSILQGQIPHYGRPLWGQLLHLSAKGLLFIAVFALLSGELSMQRKLDPAPSDA